MFNTFAKDLHTSDIAVGSHHLLSALKTFAHAINQVDQPGKWLNIKEKTVLVCRVCRKYSDAVSRFDTEACLQKIGTHPKKIL